MKSFYILKPDALKRPEVLNEYKNLISSKEYIKNSNYYLINSWLDLSMLLYDQFPLGTPIEEKITKRRQIITTIKAYDILYPTAPAIINLFDIPDDISLLYELEQMKYQIRKKYVTNTDKNYIKFLNLTSEMLAKELINIPVTELDILFARVKYNENFDDETYKMAYLNCIHFPDPDILSIESDLEIIEKSKTLTKKIKI